MFYNLSKKLNKILLETGLSITKLAQIAGMHVPNIHNFLKGKNATIPLEAVYNICQYFDVGIERLINAPLENFSIDNIKNNNASEETLQQIFSMIADVYNQLDIDKKVWFKVELQEFIDDKIKRKLK